MFGVGVVCLVVVGMRRRWVRDVQGYVSCWSQTTPQFVEACMLSVSHDGNMNRLIVPRTIVMDSHMRLRSMCNYCRKGGG